MLIQVLSSSRSQILAWNRIWREDGPGQAKCLVQVHQVAGSALCPCFIGLRRRWCSECRRMAHQRQGHKRHKRENEFHIDSLSQARKRSVDFVDVCRSVLRLKLETQRCSKRLQNNVTTSGPMDVKHRKAPFWSKIQHKNIKNTSA